MSRSRTHGLWRVKLPKSSAFTLVELLVVIGIIAVLISILLPALSRARDQAKNVQCASQLRNVGQALLMYANENKGKLPQHQMQINWLWDVSKDTRDAMVKKGGIRQMLYCPFFAEQNSDELWDFPQTAPPAQQFTVLGYCWLGKRPNIVNAAGVTTWSFPVMLARGYVETLRPPVPDKSVVPALAALYPRKSSDVELMVDAVFKQPPSPNWAAIGGWSKVHQVPHIRNGQALGGNVLFLDWHVAWRPIGDMRARVTTGSPQIQFWF